MDKAIVGFYEEARRFFQIRRRKHKRAQRSEFEFERIGFSDRLRRGMWLRVGAGHYGEAWAHDNWPNLILKISGRASWGNAWLDVDACTGDQPIWCKRLDAWPVFARHCQAHPHPMLPKIMHFEQVTQGMSWAIMPRYQKYYGPDVWGDDSEVQAIAQKLAGKMTCPEQWMWPLIQMADALNMSVDLHSHNVMMHCEQLVIIDPFSNVHEVDVLTKQGGTNYAIQ